MVILTNTNEGEKNTVLEGKRAEGLLPYANLNSLFIQRAQFISVSWCYFQLVNN